MKTRKIQYDQTVVLEFYDGNENKKEIKGVQYNANQLRKKYVSDNQNNALIYTSTKNIRPDLGSLTEQSCLYIVGHSNIDNETLASCESTAMAEHLVIDCKLTKAKRIVLVACDLGASNKFLRDLHNFLGLTYGIYTELAAYKGSLIINHENKRYVDLGEDAGHIPAAKQKLIYGWDHGEKNSRPKQIVLSDMNEYPIKNDSEISENDSCDSETESDIVNSVKPTTNAYTPPPFFDLQKIVGAWTSGATLFNSQPLIRGNASGLKKPLENTECLSRKRVKTSPIFQ